MVEKKNVKMGVFLQHTAVYISGTVIDFVLLLANLICTRQ